MSAVQIRDALLARLTVSPGLGDLLGVVQSYERYAKSLKDLTRFYQPAGRKEVRGWYLRRRRFRPVVDTSQYLEVESTWMLRGYLALDDADASELTLQGLADAIVMDLLTIGDESLGGLVLNLGPKEGERPGTRWGWELTDFAPVMFGGVLCHAATLELITTHQEPRGRQPVDLRRVTAGWNVDADPGADFTDHIELEQV